MSIKEIEPTYYVSEQITADDIESLKAQGIRSIICNRPDGEAEDQPPYADIESKATELGLEVLYIPIPKGDITEEQISTFVNEFYKLPMPVLAYCRSGMRSTSLWALANSTRLRPEDIIARATGAGYDISSLAERIKKGGKEL